MSVVLITGVVVVCCLIGWGLGELIFRIATRDHPLRKEKKRCCGGCRNAHCELMAK